MKWGLISQSRSLSYLSAVALQKPRRDRGAHADDVGATRKRLLGQLRTRVGINEAPRRVEINEVGPSVPISFLELPFRRRSSETMVGWDSRPSPRLAARQYSADAELPPAVSHSAAWPDSYSSSQLTDCAFTRPPRLLCAACPLLLAALLQCARRGAGHPHLGRVDDGR